jgi:hypothetical protein
MQKQSHTPVVRQWLLSLSVLTAVSMTRREAEMRLGAYLPMLLSEFPDAAFTQASLQHVARGCDKGFPTYPELASQLSAWWRAHRPMPVALPEPVQERQPEPTDEERAYVAELVSSLTAELKAKPLYQDSNNDLGDEPIERRPRASYLPPAQLDITNPLPGGRKRTEMSCWYCADCRIAYAGQPHCPRCGKAGVRQP